MQRTSTAIHSDSSSVHPLLTESVVDLIAEQRLAVAPMIDWTDRHCRYFMRLLNPFAYLYTEMIASAALSHHADPSYLLQFNSAEQPLVLQVGGHDRKEMCHAAVLAEQWGYREINLNIGCPSPRVQKGRFGACLMAEPALVAELVQAMRERVSIPVTVKTRLGIDDQEDYQFIAEFVRQVAAGGCQRFIIHARKAYLQGLDPKQNRTVPPLNYQRVKQLQADFPTLHFHLNGGLDSVEKCLKYSQQFSGIMIGRLAYQQPFVLAQLAQSMADIPLPTRQSILTRYLPYVAAQQQAGVRLSIVLKPVLGLYHGMPGGRLFRRALTEVMHAQNGSAEQVLEAAKHCPADC